MIAVVAGMIATFPLGGVVWDYAQYALGLADTAGGRRDHDRLARLETDGADGGEGG